MRFLILLFLAAVVATAAPPSTAADPIVGKWRWRNHNVLTVSADNTLLTDNGVNGRWEFLNNKEIERKYRFTWKNGSFEDSVVLTRDFKSLSGKRNTGEKVSGIKLD